jgi:putative chitinase
MLDMGALREFAPNALPDYLEALISEPAALQRAGLTTPLRLCHFLAQTAHETAGYVIARENTRWTPEQMCALWPGRFKTRLDPRILACRGDEQRLANLAYGGRLGNVDADDGWAYRGGGFLQLTGRAAYHDAGSALGVDLEGMPELIEDAAISLNAALYYWTKLDINRFADRNYARAVGNAINRGNPFAKKEPIGAQTRARWLERAWKLFGDGKLPPEEELALGAYGPRVGHLQARLKELGYGVGDVDQVFGPTLARAVAAFKLDNGVAEPAEIVGPATWDGLMTAAPAEVAPERALASEATLAELGSTEIAAGRGAKVAGQIALYGGGLEGARQLGALDQASQMLASVSTFKATLVPALAAVQWGLAHAFWVAAIVGGVWFWLKGRHIVAARLTAHRSGANLGR